MSGIADLYKKKQREKRKEEALKRGEEKEREARQAAEAAQRAEEIRQREAKELAARKRTLRESGLLDMLEELRRKRGLTYKLEDRDPVYGCTTIAVGKVGTAKIQHFESGWDGYYPYPVGSPEKWKVIYGAEVLVNNGGRIRVDGHWFSAADGWRGLEEALVEAIQRGLGGSHVKGLRKTFLGL